MRASVKSDVDHGDSRDSLAAGRVWREALRCAPRRLGSPRSWKENEHEGGWTSV